MFDFIDAMPAGDFLAAVTAFAWLVDRWTR